MVRTLFFLSFLIPSSLSAQEGRHISVSGLSSGAFMAAQMHVSHSKTFQGVAILAGGPYGCSGGSVTGALFQCMQTFMGTPSGDNLWEKADSLAQQGVIDPLKSLIDDKIVLLAGKNDNTVRPSVVTQNRNFYHQIPDENFLIIDEMNVGHAFPTVDKGNSCETASQSPWVSACGRDVAGEILQHFLGPLDSPMPAAASSFYKFEQPGGASMDQVGVAFVPKNCLDGELCPVHMALHGCQQGKSRGVGEFFYRNVGYNEWAQSNDIVVIYPQAVSSPGNPNQCWDWWGYIDPDYLTQQAPQIRSLKAILDSFVDGSLKLRPL